MFKSVDFTKHLDVGTASILAFFVLVRGYALFHPYVLQFVGTRSSIPVSEQGVAATFLTVVFQFLVIYFISCCLWSIRSLKSGNSNFLQPVFLGAMACAFSIATVLVML